MMYNQKLVTNVKCAGKIMREQNDVVFLPFGSEYSILLKNLNTHRAVVNIEIDGECVTGGGLILDSNQTIDLERFIIDGDLDKGPKFKFIEKTDQISGHRGDRVDDGIVRVTYRYEKHITYVDYHYSEYQYKKDVRPYTKKDVRPYTTDKLYYGSSMGVNSIDGTNITSQCMDNGNSSLMRSVKNDNGITVKGSESTQKFETGVTGELEETEHVIVLNIKGKVGENPVEIPVTVDRKIQCDICGKKSKSSNVYCGGCGNNLTYQY